MILLSAVGEEGFQNPKLTIETTLADGSKRQFEFDPTFAQPLPRPLSAPVVNFKVDRGERSHIAEVEVHGLTALPLDKAGSFFRTDATLIATKRTNAYSPSRVNRGVDSLLAELRQLGFAEAEVRAPRRANGTAPWSCAST